MSQFTRMASTNVQEQAVKKVERWAKLAGRKVVGGVTVGKAPQSVILDLTYQGSQIHVNRDGAIRVHGDYVKTLKEFRQALEQVAHA